MRGRPRWRLGPERPHAYSLRHLGESLWALTPLRPSGWISLFGTAWMPPDFTSPDDLSFEPADEPTY